MSQGGVVVLPAGVDPFDFLSNPKGFTKRYPLLKQPIKQLWQDVATTMSANMPEIESSKFMGTDIGTIQDYLDSKAELLSIYSAVEGRLGDKAKAVIGLSVGNWRAGSKYPDEDFAAEVIQFFQVIQDVNKITTNGSTVPPLSAAYLHCQLYSSVYELAGKKVLRAASFLNRKMTNMQNMGTAIPLLVQKGYAKSVSPFNNHLRNGIAHGAYIVDSSTPSNVEYSDDDGQGHVHSGTEPLTSIQTKIVSIILFLEAAIYVNADRYVDLINQSVAQSP